MTRKWTRTVPGRLAASADRDPARRPVRGEDLPDQVAARDRPPRARVARRDAVVAHHEELALADPDRRDRARVTAGRTDVRLVETLAVDVYIAAALLPQIAGKPDQALHERPARPAACVGEGRRVEDDNVVALRVPEPVTEPAGEHPVREACLAFRARLGAVQGRLHRARRDPVRVDDPGLDREDDRDRADDRDEPVDRDPPAVRQPLGQVVDRVPQRTCSLRQPSIRAWSPESSTSGTLQPRYSAGRV